MKPFEPSTFSSKSAKRRSFLCLISLLFLFAGAVMGPVRDASAQSASNLEYQVKAVFLYQFVKYVKWPVPDSPKTGTPLTVGIFHESSIIPYLKETVKKPANNNRSFSVRQMESLEQLITCKVVFFDKAYRKQWEDLLDTVADKPVLTISDSDGFAEKGGIIQFVTVGGRIKFIINNSAAKKAGLAISAKLLNLAQKVY